MKRVARLPFVLGFASAMLAPSLASAHVRFVSPTPRYATPTGADNGMNIKTGPCGAMNDSRTTDMSRITTFDAGATIMVTFNETINHPGHFRIAFDNDGQDALTTPLMRSQVQTGPTFTLPVLLDNIADGPAGMRSVMVTLPNTPCDRCTLQLIQVMVSTSTMSWPADEIYYTCADIVLRPAGGGGGMGGMSGSGGSGGGLNTGGSGGTGVGGTPPAGGFGGVSGGVGGSATGGVPTGGAAPTGGVSGAGVPATGGSAGAPPTGGAPTGGGTPGGGAPAGGVAAVDEPLEAPGCACRTLPARPSGQAFAAGALALLGLLVRRRRGSRSAAA